MSGEDVADSAELRAAVEAQAQALVGGDVAGFASYALPEALSQTYRSPVAGAPHSYEVLRVDVAGGRGRSEVRFRGSPNFVLRASWVEMKEGWRAATLEIPEEPVREGLLGRALRFGRRRAREMPQREDLS